MTPTRGKEAPPLERDVLLELIDVSHSYRARRANFAEGENQVLDGLSLAIQKGQTLGILGRNGAGKTTLLRLMAGIVAPDRGIIRWAPGIRCSLLSLGLGFQDQLTGRDNARLSALLQGASRAEADACLESINDFAELGVAFDEPVKTYSSGMRARLGFATALQTEVDVLLIDEVLSVGDREFREKAGAAMRQHIRGAQTVVIVSHSEPQLRMLCDSLAWIDQGRLREQGDPSAVLSAYGAEISQTH